MKLREARVRFTLLLATKLIPKAFQMGYDVALAEGMDRKTKKDPTSDHMNKSLHELGLAQDLDLYAGGVWLKWTEDHKPIGEYWESLDPLCRWGGRWGDGNHYSFAPPEIVGNKA